MQVFSASRVWASSFSSASKSTIAPHWIDAAQAKTHVVNSDRSLTQTRQLDTEKAENI
jgi:hypothetical protein